MAFQGQVVTLSPARWYQALVNELTAKTYPPGQTNPPEQMSIGRGSRKIAISALDLWGKFGRLITLRKGGAGVGLAIQVPSLDEIGLISKAQMQTFTETQLRPMVETVTKRPAEEANCFRSLDKNHPLGGLFRVNVEVLVEAFEELPDNEQTAAMSIVRSFLARWVINIALEWDELKRRTERLRSSGELERLGGARDIELLRDIACTDEDFQRDLSDDEGEVLRELVMAHLLASQTEDADPLSEVGHVKVLQLLIREQGTTIRTFVRVLDMFHWEEAVSPSRYIQEFLPKSNPHPALADNKCAGDEPNRSTEIRAPVLTDEQVDEKASKIDPERVRFYTEILGCKKIVRAGGDFGQKGYCAFLVRSNSKQPYALLDSPKIRNAVYVFRVDMDVEPNASPWLTEAELSKAEVRRRKTPDGPFIRRVWHSADWKDRVQKFLEMN